MRSQPQSFVLAAERTAVSQFSQAGLAAGMRLVPASGAAVADYIETLKPRVMSLVVFTGIVGMALAPGHLNPVQALIAVLCIAVGGGAAGAINMWYDRDIDALMRRTALRPLPTGRMAPGEALGFGVVLGVGAVLVMAVALNWLAAALLALTIGFYVFVYTIWLKRRTPQNIVIGGAAGAVPPVIGWAAVTGNIGWGGAGAIRHRVLMDAAAFLGIIALSGRRLRRGARTDAAGGRRCGSDQATDFLLLPGAVAGLFRALHAGHGGRALWRRRRPAQRRIHRLGDSPLGPRW